MVKKIKTQLDVLEIIAESRAERIAWVESATRIKDVTESMASQDWLLLKLLENQILIDEQEEKFKKIIKDQEDKFKKYKKESEEKYENYKKLVIEKFDKYKKLSEDKYRTHERQTDDRFKKLKK